MIIFERIKEGFARGFEKTQKEEMVAKFIMAIRKKISKLTVGDAYYYPECEGSLKLIIAKDKKKIRSWVKRVLDGFLKGVAVLQSPKQQ